MTIKTTIVTGFGFLAIAAGPALAQDAARGEELFQVCTACHSVAAGENGIGPSLAGVIGRDAGSVSGFDYSDAMKESGIVWDEATLATYIADVSGTVPGTTMSFPGVDSEQDAKDIASFLASQ